MARFGYTLMTEQAGPRELVRDSVAAESAGFDFQVISDHYFPWLAEQGHAPYAWAVLGAVTQVTDRVELMTYVTCPTMRYHPAVVAQKAATTQILADGRFTLGLGSGENLNEHVVGRGWPPADVRQDMLVEAIEIIRRLFDGGYCSYMGEHFRVDSAKLWDLPVNRVPIATAVSGRRSIERFAAASDAMVGVTPDAQMCQAWDAANPAANRKIGQVSVCWDPSRDEAVRRVHEQFRWSVTGWQVNAELRRPSAFAEATTYVRAEDVADSIPCGPDVEPIVAAVRPFWEAGYTDIALIQVGGEHQRDFLRYAEADLLPALREASAR